MNKNYYKAYDKRYKQVHDNNILWSSSHPTLEVMDVINRNGITKEDKILDLGCGEGRDAIYLLDNGYNLLAIDYSQNVINKCNEITYDKYINEFRQFDIIEDKLDEKFKFIYSVAVVHMFVDSVHRRKYFDFIYDHLEKNGIAFITTMGDGEEKYESNINDAFNDVKRINVNTDEEIIVAATSCKIVDWNQLEKELKDSKLLIREKWISDRIPDFNTSMCVVIKKVD